MTAFVGRCMIFLSSKKGREVGFFIPLPAKIASRCPSLSPHDDSVPHVTYLYVGDSSQLSLGVLEDCFHAATSEIKRPVTASLSGIDYFRNPDSDTSVAHIPVTFDYDMAKLRDSLREELEDSGVLVQDSFPVYRPHVTLAYLDGLDSSYSGDLVDDSFSFSGVEIWGFGQNPVKLSFGGVSARKLVSKYLNKKENPDGRDVYEYGPRQLSKRHKEKAKRIESLRANLAKLRSKLRRDLDSSDEDKRAVALVVSLMDNTYERIGNPASAERGHFGVTGWKVKHIKFKGDSATLSYVGKSGVKHDKTLENKALVGLLKKEVSGKSKEDSLVSCGSGGCVSANDVNEYLKDFGVTAKDIRGLHANQEMIRILKRIRSESGELPTARKERKAQLKEEFNQALDETSSLVGHKSSTLRSNYLVPGLEDDFLADGSIQEKLYKEATKSVTEKEDSDSSRQVRPSPKKKPPRKDRQRNRLHVDDKDIDRGDRGDDPDLSLNYKRVGMDVKNIQSLFYNTGHISGEVSNGNPLESAPLMSSNQSDLRRYAMKKMTRKGAMQVIAQCDKFANLFEFDYAAMGIPARVAKDLAYRMDMISTFLTKQAKLHPSIPTPGNFDATEISKYQPGGALRSDADEPYMRTNFTEIETQELHQKVDSGDIDKVDGKRASTLDPHSSSYHGFDLFGE